jgi:hypothetical protein
VTGQEGVGEPAEGQGDPHPRRRDPAAPQRDPEQQQAERDADDEQQTAEQGYWVLGHRGLQGGYRGDVEAVPNGEVGRGRNAAQNAESGEEPRSRDERSRRLLDTDRERSAALLSNLRDQTIGAIEEIRRLVYDLRPPALDGMGLVGAVREYAAVLGRRRDGTPVSVSVEASADLAELPAAVEVAAYRIATER